MKVKRVTTGRNLGAFGHLEVPKIEFGSPAVKTNDVVAARGRRPSIAPVPAMLGEVSSSSSETESDDEKSDPNNDGGDETTGHPNRRKDSSTSGKEGGKDANIDTKEGAEKSHFQNHWTFPAENSAWVDNVWQMESYTLEWSFH